MSGAAKRRIASPRREPTNPRTEATKKARAFDQNVAPSTMADVLNFSIKKAKIIDKHPQMMMVILNWEGLGARDPSNSLIWNNPYWSFDDLPFVAIYRSL